MKLFLFLGPICAFASSSRGDQTRLCSRFGFQHGKEYRFRMETKNLCWNLFVVEKKRDDFLKFRESLFFGCFAADFEKLFLVNGSWNFVSIRVLSFSLLVLEEKEALLKLVNRLEPRRSAHKILFFLVCCNRSSGVQHLNCHFLRRRSNFSQLVQIALREEATRLYNEIVRSRKQRNKSILIFCKSSTCFFIFYHTVLFFLQL
jgi:hypothetical protein